MDYELAKELEDAGYKGLTHAWVSEDGMSMGSHEFEGSKEVVLGPTLEELIEACATIITARTTDFEEHWFELYWNYDYEEKGKIFQWGAGYSRGANRDNLDLRNNYFGPTPSEAVARLYLALNKK